MNFKRIISFIISGIIVICFSGCQSSGDDSSDYSVIQRVIETEEIVGGDGSSGSSSNGNGQAGSQNTSAGSDSDNKTTSEAKQKLDFGGKTITILREWGAYPSGQYTAWDNWNDNVDRVEKEFNVKIVEKKWNTTLAQEVLAGVKPEGQLYQISSATVYNYASNGYIADFNSAMKKTGIDMTSDKFNKFNVQLNNINGKQYTAGYGFARVPAVIIFNKTMTDRAGYDIYDLISKKQWTWDKMTEIAEKLTVRSSSGEVTQYGIGLETSSAAALALSNNSNICIPGSDGKYKVQLSSEGTRAALQQIYDWVNVNKVASFNYGQMTWTQLSQDFAAKKIAMYFTGHDGISRAYTSLKDEWGIAYIPMGPNAKEYVSMLTDEYSYVVPSAYANMTSDLLLLLDELYKMPDGYSRDDQFRDEWIRFFKDKEAYNMFKTLHDGTVRQVWDGTTKVELGNNTTSYAAAIGQLFEGIMTPGTFVDTYQNTFQTNVNDRTKDIKYTGSIK